MKITQYKIDTPKINRSLNIACVADLHGRKSDAVIEALRAASPDVILLAGDILEVSNTYMQKRNENAMRFLENVVKIAPTYYCFGNHEIYYSHTPKEINRVPNMDMEVETLRAVRELGIRIINDSFEAMTEAGNDSVLIGGLVCGMDMNPALETDKPNLEFLNAYDREESFKILLCHYPHYYDEYLKNTSFDLILSGHAHGGQWRFFGQGIYSPHQGLFPKYTSGIYDGRFIISRGAVNNSWPIPRIFNPCEVLCITISPENKK